MHRFTFAACAALMSAAVAARAAGPVHNARVVGSAVDPNSIVVEAVDVEINQVPPADFINSFAVAVSILTPQQHGVRLANFQPGLAPPNPPSDGDQFTTFFTTARHYPNTQGLVPNPSFQPGPTSADELGLVASWGSANRGDGQDDDGQFKLSRFTFARPVGSGALTLAPIGTPVAAIQGESALAGPRSAPYGFSFTLYQIPEPAALHMLAPGALALLRRRS